MPPQTELIYYLNTKRSDEARAISDIVLTYNWPHIDLLVGAELQYDGFLDTFTQLFDHRHPGELNVIVIEKDESVRNLLIQLEDVITTRAVRLER